MLITYSGDIIYIPNNLLQTVKKYRFSLINGYGGQTFTETVNYIEGDTAVGVKVIVLANEELYIGGSLKQKTGADAGKERPVMMKYALNR